MTPTQLDALNDLDYDAMVRLMRAEAEAIAAQNRKHVRTR
jgi:hypothetical protein